MAKSLEVWLVHKGDLTVLGGPRTNPLCMRSGPLGIAEPMLCARPVVTC